MPFYP